MRITKLIFTCLALFAFALILSSITAPQVMAQSSSQSVTGKNVTSAYFNGGRFEQTANGVWHEYGTSGGPRFTFRETYRDDWSVYLRDESRNGDLQIDVHRKMISAGWDGSPRSDLYPVTRFGTGSNTPTPVKSNADICFDLIQGKVPWDKNGNKDWNDANVKNLCQGTRNPAATRDCFTRGINSGAVWSAATNSCRSNTNAYRQTSTPTTTRPTSPSANNVVTLYQHCNYTGYSVSLPVGNYSLSALQSKGMKNDDISSIKVSSGYQADIYKDAGYQGTTRRLTGNTSCLTRQNMNDVLSSIRVSTRSSQTPTPPAPRPVSPPSKSNEEVCFDLFQNKVAWDKAGNKAWNAANLKNLCQGTRNPTATRDCFTRGIKSGAPWTTATDSCKVNTNAFRQTNSGNSSNLSTTSITSGTTSCICTASACGNGAIGGNYGDIFANISSSSARSKFTANPNTGWTCAVPATKTGSSGPLGCYCKGYCGNGGVGADPRTLKLGVSQSSIDQRYGGGKKGNQTGWVCGKVRRN